MPALLVMHDSNKHNVSDFPNDANSRDENEKRRLAKAKAAQDALNLGSAQSRAEQERLEKARADEAMITKLQSEKTDLELKIAAAATETNSRIKAKDEVIQKYRTERDEQASKEAALRLDRLDWNNNLNPRWHNRKIFINNTTSRTNLDFGADNGTRAYGFLSDPRNENQILRLTKVNPDDKKSGWLIECDKTGKYLGIKQNTDYTLAVTCSERYRDGDAPWQEWYIGEIDREPGQYVLQCSRVTQAVLSLSNTHMNESGVSLGCYSRCVEDTQKFTIWFAAT